MTANKDQKRPDQDMRSPQDRPGKTPALEKYNAQHAGRIQRDGSENNAAARVKRAESKDEEPSLPEDDA